VRNVRHDKEAFLPKERFDVAQAHSMLCALAFVPGVPIKAEYLYVHLSKAYTIVHTIVNYSGDRLKGCVTFCL
jgi:hypothetical protein